jgi:hypothetical protein
MSRPWFPIICREWSCLFGSAWIRIFNLSLIGTARSSCFPAVTLVALIVAAVRSRKRCPLATFGIAALPTSPLAAYAVMSLAEVVQEHRAYIPTLGAALLFAAGLHVASRRRRGREKPILIADV